MDAVSQKQKPQQARAEKSYLFYLSNAYPNGPYEQQVDRHTTGVTIQNPATENIPREDTISVWDSKEKRYYTRRIRFIAKCDSIFFDEQKAMGYDEKYEPNANDVISFENGQRIVSERENNLLKYFEATNFNEDNPNRDKSVTALFKKDNSSEILHKNIADDRMITKAKAIIFEMSDDELAETQKVFPSIRFDVKTQKTELVAALVRVATENPGAIISGLNEEKNTVLREIADALELELIVMTGKGYCYLSEGKAGECILEVSNPKKAQGPDLLAKFMLSDNNGKSIRLQLQRMVERSKQKVELSV